MVKVNLSGRGGIARGKIVKSGSRSANLSDGVCVRVCGQRMAKTRPTREVRSSDREHTHTHTAGKLQT